MPVAKLPLARLDAGEMDRVTFLRRQAEQFRELAGKPMNVALRDDFLALAARCEALADQIAASGTAEDGG